LPLHALPQRLIERHQLGRLTHERCGEREFQFHYGPASRLPVRHEGQLLIVRWGCGRDDSRVLPVGGWTKQTTVESGFWYHCGAEEVEIPAALARDGGVWYSVRQGLRGVLVQDERGER